MPKVADKYYQVDPWKIVEAGFQPQQATISESIFSLSNEYMGVRGYFEEGYAGESLVGSYINGVYEKVQNSNSHYKGIVDHFAFMINTVDWLYTRIRVDGELLEVSKAKISSFVRELDMRSGLLRREFIWETARGKRLKIEFQRMLSMVNARLGYQRIIFSPLNFSGTVDVQSGLDFSLVHHSQPGRHWDCVNKGRSGDLISIMAQTKNSKIAVVSAFKLDLPRNTEIKYKEHECFVGAEFEVALSEGQEVTIDKRVVNYWKRLGNENALKRFQSTSILSAAKGLELSFDQAQQMQVKYWAAVWEKNDIVIDGDEENQQGIRYCIYQLHQTFHGKNPGLNIGAKGLTGEAYSGHAFWDTETYCLPFYLFSNPHAAKNLLLFRYKGLENAKARANELDCGGACYPIATQDGTESCNLWQHASLQFQPSTGVAYGIWHYYKITNDLDFLYDQGIEMLVEISRFLKDRCQKGQRSGKVGFYGVMGPDEFQMMVNHNCYTNFMAKKTFLFTLDVIENMKQKSRSAYESKALTLNLSEQEIKEWGAIARKMYIPLDNETGIYEQHDGFFDLPHIDIDAIPESEFPLYNHWSYDRIYRNDMIKQPDVLMFMFLYNQEFSVESKVANYEYYESRCIHESSLSPSIHSILAAEIGKEEEAFAFFEFATRLDLDNYNRNTNEGLHLTSIAAAWMNIVYGFGGMRSDGDILIFQPILPKSWNGYSFKVVYQGSVIEVKVRKDGTAFRITSGQPQVVKVNGRAYEISEQEIQVMNSRR